MSRIRERLVVKSVLLQQSLFRKICSIGVLCTLNTVNIEIRNEDQASKLVGNREKTVELGVDLSSEGIDLTYEFSFRTFNLFRNLLAYDTFSLDSLFESFLKFPWEIGGVELGVELYLEC